MGMVTGNVVCTAMPNPQDSFIIYKAQSLLTKDGKVGPILPLEDARKVVEEAEKEWPR